MVPPVGVRLLGGIVCCPSLSARAYIEFLAGAGLFVEGVFLVWYFVSQLCAIFGLFAYIHFLCFSLLNGITVTPRK